MKVEKLKKCNVSNAGIAHKGRCRFDEKIRRRAEEEPMMKQRRPDDVIHQRADVDPMRKSVVGPMKSR